VSEHVQPSAPGSDEPANAPRVPVHPRRLGAKPASQRPQRTVIRFGVVFRSIGTVFVAAAVIATIFTWWTPSSFLPAESAGALAVALATQASITQATPIPATALPPLRGVGIISGHSGENPAVPGVPDPGAVCDDGLTEAEVNRTIAELAAEMLRGEGYQVEILDEWDERLNGYRAAVLVSVHADSCAYVNESATGFKVASLVEAQSNDAASQLVACLVARYADATGLPFHPSVTYDMTQYHTFREVDPATPGAIIEVGFLYMDRDLLTQHPEQAARGLADGILCYLRQEPVEREVVGSEGEQ
jgi:N-acetylmuramoyl-L-alanine amidase